MRITQGMITRNYLTSLHGGLENLSKAQQRLSSGRRFTRLSENVADGIRALQVRKQMDVNYQQQLNVRDAQGVINTGYDALKSVESVLHTAKEKAQRAYNGTNGPDDRDTVADEIRGLMDQVVSFMNVRYADHFIFSGTNNAQPPFTVEDKRLREGVELTMTADAVMTFKAGTTLNVPGGGTITLDSAQDIILKANDKVTVNKDGSVSLDDGTSFSVIGKTKVDTQLALTALDNGTIGKTKGTTTITIPGNVNLNLPDMGGTVWVKADKSVEVTVPEGTELVMENGEFTLPVGATVTLSADSADALADVNGDRPFPAGTTFTVATIPVIKVKDAEVTVAKGTKVDITGQATVGGKDVTTDAMDSAFSEDATLKIGPDGAVTVPAGTAVDLSGFSVSPTTTVGQDASLRLDRTTETTVANSEYPLAVTAAGRIALDLPADTILKVGGEEWTLTSDSTILIPSGSELTIGVDGKLTLSADKSVILPRGTEIKRDDPDNPGTQITETLTQDISANLKDPANNVGPIPDGTPLRLAGELEMTVPDGTVLNGTGGKTYTTDGANTIKAAQGTVVTFKAGVAGGDGSLTLSSNQKVTVSAPMTVEQTDVKGELGDGTAAETADGEEYKLNGTSILDKNGDTIPTLYYNGVDVDTPGLKSGDIPENGKLYIDLGMGYSIEADGNVDPRTGFEVSFDGFMMLGGGTETLLDEKGNVLYGEDGKPYQVSNNVYNLLGQVAELLEKPNLSESEHTILGRLIDRVESTRQDFHNDSIADLDNRASFLDSTLEGLENQYDNLIESRSKLEAVDDYRETMNVKMFEYSWFATLKMGNKILPQSLMDFIS